MKMEAKYFILIFCVMSAIPPLFAYEYCILQHGEAYGDSKLPRNDDGSSPEVHIQGSDLFPFWDEFHGSFWVNTNGLISFHGSVSQYTPEPFPLDPPDSLGDLVAPYWADADIRVDGRGDVFYRQITDQNDEVMSRVNDIIRDNVDGFHNFCATWILVATWDHVPYYNAYDYYYYDITNTFQCLLVTDGRYSFAIFNNENILWTTGTASGGDSYGLGGTPAYVGYTGGDAASSYNHPSSGTDDIVNVDMLSTLPGKPCRYIHRLENKVILPHLMCGPNDFFHGPCKLELDPGCDCRVYRFFCSQDTDDRPYYEKAAELCQTFYDGLAILDTEQKVASIVGEIHAFNLSSESCIPLEGFWIGLDDTKVEGHFVWSSDVVRKGLCPGSYSDWGENEPNDNDRRDASGQDCGQIWFDPNGPVFGQWDDEYCDYRAKGFICETRVPHCDYHAYGINANNIRSMNSRP